MNHQLYQAATPAGARMHSVQTVNGQLWHLYPGTKEGQSAAQCRSAPYSVQFLGKDEQGDLYALQLEGDDHNSPDEIGLYSSLYEAMTFAGKREEDATRVTGLLTWRPQHDDLFDTVSRAGNFAIEAKSATFDLYESLRFLASHPTLEAAQDEAETRVKAIQQRERLAGHAPLLLQSLEKAHDFIQSRACSIDSDSHDLLDELRALIDSARI